MQPTIERPRKNFEEASASGSCSRRPGLGMQETHRSLVGALGHLVAGLECFLAAFCLPGTPRVGRSGHPGASLEAAFRAHGNGGGDARRAGQVHDRQDPDEAHRRARREFGDDLLHREPRVLVHDGLLLRHDGRQSDVLSLQVTRHIHNILRYTGPRIYCIRLYGGLSPRPAALLARGPACSCAAGAHAGVRSAETMPT